MLQSADDLYGLQSLVLRAIASPRRLEILHLLGGRRMNVHEIGDILGLNQPAVSAHLAALRSVGLVEPVRSGRGVQYGLTDPRVVTACSILRDVLASRLERLNRALASMSDIREPSASVLEPRPVLSARGADRHG